MKFIKLNSILYLRNTVMGSRKTYLHRQNKKFCLRQITKASYYVSNNTFYKELSIQTLQNIGKIYYKRLHSNLHNHRNPLISGLSVPFISWTSEDA